MVTACNAQVGSAHPETSSARPSWASTRPSMTLAPVVIPTANLPVRLRSLDRMCVSGCSRTSLTGHRVQAMGPVRTAFVLARARWARSEAGLTEYDSFPYGCVPIYILT